jgi:hypothetical protein
MKEQTIQILNAVMAATSSPFLPGGQSADLGVPTENENLLFDVSHEKGRLSE